MNEVRLPAPCRDRFQPLRSGLVNLYRYDDQELWFEGGHLLLRGNNGTGKSRVLALQLPFLLDGEVAPHRMEPDGDPAKRVEWNLLLGGRHADRVHATEHALESAYVELVIVDNQYFHRRIPLLAASICTL